MVAMSTRSKVPTIPSPADPEGGFLLIDDRQAEGQVELASSEGELADGSDVHDIDAMERALGAESVDEVLRAYLEDAIDIPALPLPPVGRRGE